MSSTNSCYFLYICDCCGKTFYNSLFKNGKLPIEIQTHQRLFDSRPNFDSRPSFVYILTEVSPCCRKGFTIEKVERHVITY